MTQTSAWKAETEAETYAPFAMVRLDLPSGTVRFFSGIGEQEWDGETWTGAGNLGVIGAIEGSTELRAGTLQIGLTGLDATIKADALDSLTRGSEVYVYMGFFDVATGDIVVDPWLAFFGEVDQATISETDQGVDIMVTCLDGVGAMLRRTEHRRTSADQEAMFAGDSVFEFVADQPVLNWGAPGASDRASVRATLGNSDGRPPGPLNRLN
jgi:hypothetical protein